MSNHLAIATVTAALAELVLNAVRPVIGTAGVSTVRPGGSVANPGVNLYLYETRPNAAGRNLDLPTRSGGGGMVQRPRAALDLHYLLSFHGSDKDLEPQRLMGAVVRTLHGRPLITRALIRDAAKKAPLAGLADKPDLAEEPDLVRLSPHDLSLDDLTKLWSAFQAEFELSMACRAGIVFIEPEEAPQPGLPVLARQIHTLPFGLPTIDAVEPAMMEAVAGATLTVRGVNLMAGDTQVVLGAAAVAPKPGSTGQALAVALPAGVRAGVVPVQVVQRLWMGAPSLHPGFESNVAALVLRPQAPVAAYDAVNKRFSVTASPAVGAAQRVELLLNEAGAAQPRACTLPVLPRAADADPLLFDAGKAPVAAGTYLVRLRVDGADSLLARDPVTGAFTGPTVVVP